MSYAQHRTIIDADSHIIELDDFLFQAATAEDRALIPAMDAQTELPVPPGGVTRARELFAKRQGDPEVMAKFEEKLLDNRKGGWTRIGAFDPEERSHCLDLLGFRLQLVLPTFAFHQVAHCKDRAVLEAGARTLNRAMGRFCSKDERLKAIGYVPLSLGPDVAGKIIDDAYAAGCYSLMVDTNEPDDAARSFTHPDFDPVWARFQEAGAPFVNHVAVNGDYKAVPRSFRNNARSTGELGVVTIKNSAEIFLSAMIFDGVFARHPRLRGISMEHGAFWVPSWMQALDYAGRSFRLKDPPSDTVRRHLKISPFAGEPVGWIIGNVGPELLVFGSDYPHPEGTSDPIGKFEASMPDCDTATLSAFFHGNMEELMGIRLAT